MNGEKAIKTQKSGVPTLKNQAETPLIWFDLLF